MKVKMFITIDIDEEEYQQMDVLVMN